MAQVIIIGGGLAGMSAAHTVLQSGAHVLLLDKSAFCGGNSSKATSGINAAGSRTQRALGIGDAPEIFEADTNKSAAELVRPNLTKALTHQSGPAVDWLMDSFALDLNVCSRLAAHSHPRTHRGGKGGQFPGMMITYSLMEELDNIAATGDGRAEVINKANVTKLIQDPATGKVIGCSYEKAGEVTEVHGPVIIATGGFGADFTDNSLLSQVEDDWKNLEVWKTEPGLVLPPLRSLSTTNGPHCTGDGIKLATDLGADVYDLHCVQVHPTGLVDFRDPEAKVKWLCAEALRGHGGVLLDKNGDRFCNELGKRDYVTGRMWNHNKGPYRLCLSSGAAAEIDWHCKHYKDRGLMISQSGREMAADMGIPIEKLQATLARYNKGAKADKDEWGKLYINNPPPDVDDVLHVAQVLPCVHYCMGGIATDENGKILTKANEPIPGLFGAGEVLGGIHGANRLGGSSLLDCVVYGRLAGASAAKYLLGELIEEKAGGGMGGSNPMSANVTVDPDSQKLTIEFGWGGAKAAPKPAAVAAPAAIAAPAPAPKKMLSMAEVAKHTAKDDCWVILEGQVYDVTDFLDDHPGGKGAILLYGGKDATEQFMMLHKADIIPKYAAEYHIGEVMSAKL